MEEKDKEWYLKKHSKFDKEIEINFTETEERGWSVEATLPFISANMLVDIKVNGERYIYTIRYNDAGTPYTQKMEGEINVRGFLSNVSINWSTIPPNSVFPVISFKGVVNEKQNTMQLKLFALK